MLVWPSRGSQWIKPERAGQQGVAQTQRSRNVNRSLKPDGFDHGSGREPRPELSFPCLSTRRTTVAIATDTDRIRELNDKLRGELS